ncbi:uncharacterized protein LOC126328056 [Schistocerca gregaria]|uniref:uncharacterized protein LOC126328056 n=1 Tax=Schistocerca gregaria TaxID=7010 RepID=UPI00211DE7FF|nr:uncharacterized protein LOC126328056 [Schistocerca gregaria]XP_049851914.1 uncharacterized protein LOC126328056 [Schistocerca gregaria]
MQFEGSTHALRWIFSRSKLDELYKKADRRSFPANKESADGELQSGAEECMTDEEEAIIVAMNEKQLLDLCNHLKAPESVTYTALTFLRRYYLYHSVIEYDPSEVTVTCLFIASKVEENREITAMKLHLTVKNFEIKNMIEIELPIMAGINFDLQVFLPFRPLYGFVLDLQDVVPQPDPSYYSSLYSKAHSILLHSMRTDAMFLYSPSQLALAALISASRSLEDGKFAPYVDQYLKSAGLEYAASKLEQMDMIKVMLAELPPIDSVKRRNAVRKLKLLRSRLSASSLTKTQDAGPVPRSGESPHNENQANEENAKTGKLAEVVK